MPLQIGERDIELDAREIRILGCLVEKELSTPDYYPMTVNALTTACNQKTNREPVVEYSEEDVAEAVEQLQRKRLVGSASSSHGRAAKVRHALAEVLQLDKPQRAVLASMLLRGPETPGEIRGRIGRMHVFESLEAVDAVLDALQSGDVPLVVELPRRPGQKEARYMHVFGGGDVTAQADVGMHADEAGRLAALESEVAELRASLETLAESFRTFRKQFE